MSKPNIIFNINNFETQVESKKKIINIFSYLLKGFYNSNYYFVKISGIKISYENLYIFLKQQEDLSVNSLLNRYKENLSDSVLVLALVYLLKSIFKKSSRFEFFVMFIHENNQNPTICHFDIILCVKSLSFDSFSFVKVYIEWLLRDLNDILVVDTFLLLDGLLLFFESSLIDSVCLFFIYNTGDFRFFSNTNKRFEQFFLYTFIESYVNFLGIDSFVSVLGLEIDNQDIPSCLAPLNDSKSVLNIIHILSIYMYINNAFLDINSNTIYIKVSKQESVSFKYFCTIDDLKKNFLYIFFYVKTNSKIDYYGNPSQFTDIAFPFISVFCDSNLLQLIDDSFLYLKKNPLVLQRFFKVELNIVQYNNGYYSFFDNCFYSYSFLEKYSPINYLKKKHYVYPYLLEVKSYKKSFYLKHDLMLFLKKSQKDLKNNFICFLDILFNTTLPFSVYTITLDTLYKNKLIKLLKVFYKNSPFLFYDIAFEGVDNLVFSKSMPLFIISDDFSVSTEKLIYFFSKNNYNRPSKIVFIKTNKIIFPVEPYFDINNVTLHSSFLSSFFKIIDKSDASIDLFIILNMYYFKEQKLKSEKKFLQQFFLTDPYRWV